MEPRVIRVNPGEEIHIICSANGNSKNNNYKNENFEVENVVEENIAVGGGKRKNRTAKKGGKRAPNPYMKFASKARPEILKEHPELKSDVVGVARKIGEKWRAMSDSEKAKY